MGQRLFVAAVPPPEVVEDLDEFLAVRREAADFRWTVPEQWHLTLAFAGAVPDRVVEDLIARLHRAAAKREPMTGRIRGAGAFPDAARARVLWAGVELDDPVGLSRLATGCRAAVSKAGAEVAGERFRPHLTLARIARPTEVSRWLQVLETYRGPEYRIDEITLIASHLGEGPRKRPRYEVLDTFGLGPRRSA